MWMQSGISFTDIALCLIFLLLCDLCQGMVELKTLSVFIEEEIIIIYTGLDSMCGCMCWMWLCECEEILKKYATQNMDT